MIPKPGALLLHPSIVGLEFLSSVIHDTFVFRKTLGEVDGIAFELRGHLRKLEREIVLGLERGAEECGGGWGGGCCGVGGAGGREEGRRRIGS